MIKRIIKKILNNDIQTLILGRWKVDYNKQIVNRKIDLSNTDNCGISGNNLKNSPILISTNIILNK